MGFSVFTKIKLVGKCGATHHFFNFAGVALFLADHRPGKLLEHHGFILDEPE
jgi:hypothetical protein